MASSKRERFFKYNTLAILLCGVEGRKLTVEMKNDSYVRGTLQSADGFMNLSMKEAVLTSPKGVETEVDIVHVKASSIRYIHLPSDVNPVAAIKQQLKT